MDAITREALKRASQMHRQSKTPAATEEKPKPKAQKTEKPQESNLLASLFKDKDRSIILMLLILLMGEEVEPSLLLALIYILI